MRHTMLAMSILLATSAANADDAIFRLSGWAEIPSTFLQPGPVSGQFQTFAGGASSLNGVTPPYAGQPIPGFSGMIPAPPSGRPFVSFTKPASKCAARSYLARSW